MTCQLGKTPIQENAKPAWTKRLISRLNSCLYPRLSSRLASASEDASMASISSTRCCTGFSFDVVNECCLLCDIWSRFTYLHWYVYLVVVKNVQASKRPKEKDKEKRKKENRNLGLGDRFLLHLQCMYSYNAQDTGMQVTHGHVFYTHASLD